MLLLTGFLVAFRELFEKESDDVVQGSAAARRHHCLYRGQALGDGRQNVEEDVGFQCGQKHHVILGKALEQRVVRLTQFRIVQQIALEFFIDFFMLSWLIWLRG